VTGADDKLLTVSNHNADTAFDVNNKNPFVIYSIANER